MSETREYKGYTIEIWNDDNPMNPRTEWDNTDNMICWHSRYNLGDKHNYDDSEEFLWDIANMDARLGSIHRDDFNWDGVDKKLVCKGRFITNKWNDRMDYLMDQARKLNFILPLYLYDHSGITMSTGGFSCPWDSGQVGYIYISKEKAREEHPMWTEEYISKNPHLKIHYLDVKVETEQDWEKRVISYLEGSVKVYDQFCTGEVYGYTIEETGDSCGGYYGDWEPNKNGESESGLWEEVVGAIEGDIEKRKEKALEYRAEQFKALKRLIKRKINIYYREPFDKSLEVEIYD